MDALPFEHHLTSPQGQGRSFHDAFTASAGGAACCDEVSISIQVQGDRVSDAGFTASGCGAATAAASAAVTLVRGASVLSAARIGPSDVADELGGLSPAKQHAADLAADALARALGAAVTARAQLEPSPGRTLVAMSGGVDSAVAAHLLAGQGEAVAVTLELWADPENDAESSCCSASAVFQARALAQRMGLAHLTVDLREAFRDGVVEPFIAGYAGGETPNPCVGCNGHVRLDAMLALADHWARRPWPRAITRAWPSPGIEMALCFGQRPIRPRIRPTCSRLWLRRRWPGCASPSVNCTRPRYEGLPLKPGYPWRARPTARTSAS